MEQQLIGRVHRIGQKQNVIVHTIAIENTIEARQAKQRELWRSSKDSIAGADESGNADFAACKRLKWLITGITGY